MPFKAIEIAIHLGLFAFPNEAKMNPIKGLRIVIINVKFKR
jgi:hypothetical protein